MKFRKKPVVIEAPQFAGNAEGHSVDFHLGDAVLVLHMGVVLGGGTINAISRSINPNGGITWDLKFTQTST